MEQLKLLNLVVLLKKILEFMRKYKLNKVLPLKLVHYIIYRFLKKLQITKVGKNIMFLGESNIMGLCVHSFWEEKETKLLKKILEKGDNVIDIGANIGYYTLIFAEIVGENGKVFAFEPERNNFLTLMRNIRINKYNNVILVRKAISNKNGIIKLYFGENSGSNRIFKVNDYEKFTKVQTTTLDNYFNNFNEPIKLIKIDIEGAEISAISKGKKLIKKNPNLFLLTEFFPELIKRFGYKPIEYLKLLKSYEFKLFPIFDDNHQEYVNIFCKKEVS